MKKLICLLYCLRIKYRKGKILISEPFFLIHFSTGPLYILLIITRVPLVILNKKLEIKVCDAISGFEGWEEHLSMGGPVAPDTLLYLHSMGNMIPKSVWIDENIFWEAISNIRNMIKSGSEQIPDKIFPWLFRMVTGQLERELKENSWVIARVTTDVVLNNQLNISWKKIPED